MEDEEEILEGTVIHFQDAMIILVTPLFLLRIIGKLTWALKRN